MLPIYLKVVESSHFNSSDKAVKLMDEVEEVFLKHFAENDKRKAMKYLRPSQRKESHSVTFFIGNSPFPPKSQEYQYKFQTIQVVGPIIDRVQPQCHSDRTFPTVGFGVLENVPCTHCLKIAVEVSGSWPLDLNPTLLQSYLRFATLHNYL